MARAEHIDLFTGRLKLRHLVVALTIAEHGSAVAAASALYVSQPAVTRLLHELEATLGVELFERTSQGMAPTPYAEPFLRHARAAISHLRHGTEHVRELASADRGSVTVGLHLAGSALLQEAVLALKREKPLVQVTVLELSPPRLRAELSTGGVDLVVSRSGSFAGRDRQIGDALVHEHLLHETVCVVVARDSPLLADAPWRLAGLIDHPWVLPPPGLALREELERAFDEAAGHLPRNTVETTSLATIQRLTGQGGFIALLPEQAVEPLGSLTPLPVADCRLSTSVSVAWAEDHRPGAVSRLLLQHLRDAAARARGPAPRR